MIVLIGTREQFKATKWITQKQAQKFCGKSPAEFAELTRNNPGLFEFTIGEIYKTGGDTDKQVMYPWREVLRWFKRIDESFTEDKGFDNLEKSGSISEVEIK